MLAKRPAAVAAAMFTFVVLGGCDNAGDPLPDLSGDQKSTSVNVGGEVIGGSTTTTPTGVVRAGVAVVDDTWQVGACAGQYCDDNTTDPTNLLTGGEVDPFVYHREKDKSYGVQSRLTTRALVIEGANGRRIALLKTDNYLAQDMLVRRVAQILETHATSGIHYDDILYHVTHDHSSPYYATLSWGVWLFEDAYDQRAFEFQARKMAQAIETAAANLRPVRMGATVVHHPIYKGNVVRHANANDGTPAGYPLEYNDHQLTLLRFDDISNPSAPKPYALWANWGEHPESLDGYELHSADYLASLERFVQRDTGAPLIWSQGDVGSSENTGNASQVLDDAGKVCGTWFDGTAAPQSFSCPTGQGVVRDWDHRGYVATERNARYLADAIKDGFTKIGASDPSVVVPYSSNFPVDALSTWVMGPVSHPYPSVGNCVTDTTTSGDPGVPAAGLPDCARLSDNFPTDVFEPLIPVIAGIGQLAADLQNAGLPIPDNYDLPAFGAVEENLRLRLQAFRIGDVILASCACEAQNDLILNLKSRLNDKRGDIYDGFDWACLMPGYQNDPGPGGAWSAACARQAAYFDPATPLNDRDGHPASVPGRVFTHGVPADDALIAHMRAEVHNDARGWDALTNVLAAESEPTDITKIFGNFTKEEIQDLGVPGYKLAVGVGHAGDYNGYTVSFREYQNRDSYRKALTSYGPHTADYMVTRLVRMAAQLQGGPSFSNGALSNVETFADESRQRSEALALGQLTNDSYNLWLNAVPSDPTPPKIVTQPQNIEHFNAATVSWIGGSSAIDNPVARVERLVSGTWQPFADMTGEVQTMVGFPDGAQGVVTTWTGGQEWHWTANFEAYAAHPTRLGSTPPGTYRFVVDGTSRLNTVDTKYHLVSAPFAVTNWGGLAVQNAALDSLGNVTFDFAPLVYPRTYASGFRFVHDNGDPRLCDQCTFRPWAKNGVARSAVVTVRRASGTVQTFAATLQTSGHWKAATKLLAGDVAFIAPGGLRDNNNETNRGQLALASR